MNDPVTYDEAKKRAQELKEFYQHLVVYVLVNAFLFVINWLTSRGTWWFYWPLFGWGIGVAAHGASVFLSGGLWGKAWEERKIRQLMGGRERADRPPES
jgi:hypothetical protein